MLGAFIFVQHKNLQHERLFSMVDTKIQLQLSQLRLPVAERKIERQGIFLTYTRADFTIRIPLHVSIDQLLTELKQAFEPYGIQTFQFKENNLKDTYQIYIELGKEEVLTHKLNFSLEKARVALLIDDFGYTQEDALMKTFFEELSVPFTASIIPGTKHAQDIANKAYEKEKQVLVHMPMQPKGDFKNEYRWIILGEMAETEIKKQVIQAIESIPHAEGLNNHMGSLITARKDSMIPVLEVLKEKGLFFVDSKTSPSSIAYAMAQEMGVKSTYNCVFLDNIKEEAHIEEQFKKLISQAIDNGWVLGLGHANITTASTLKQAIKSCDNRKINFVFASEILN